MGETENQDKFEEDGFVAGENDESDMEGVFSDGDEDGRCVICNDGGELMICQACARVANIEVGPIGHEFPVTMEYSNKSVEQADGHDAAAYDDDDDDDGNDDGDGIRNEKTKEKLLQQDIDCEETLVVKPSANSNNNSKRRFVLEDSDSD